ncbi:MAG: ABC transporter substrate-binding protein [Cumulibacter sp.]
MSRWAHRRFGIGAIAMAAAVALAGCGDAPSSSTEPDTNEYPSEIALADDFNEDATFTFGYTAFPPSWDPTKSTSAADRIFYIPVYDGLFIEGVDGPEPGLVTDYVPNDDGTSVTMHLREGLTFSDGTPWDAEAAKFNLDRNRAEGSRIAGELSMVTDVEAVDDMTLKVDTDGSIGALQVSLSTRGGMVVSPKAVESGVIDDEPVGIGPYVTTAISPGVEATYERTPDYWDPTAQNVAKRVHKFIADDQARYNALVSGELDGAQVNPDQVNTVQEAGLLPVIKPSSLFLVMGMNSAMPPFDNIEVRKALNMAIDREGISQGLYDGLCTPQATPFPKDGVAYNEEIGDGLDEYPYDPEKAKEILEAEGVTDLKIDTLTPNVTIYTKFAEVVQDNLADVGITVDVRPMPSEQLVQEFMIDKTAPTTSAVTTGITDPNMLWGSFLAPNAPQNPGGEYDEEMEKYAKEGAASLDPAERNKGYSKMVEHWMERPPAMVPVCMIHLAAAFGDDISGVAQHTSGLPNMRHVAKSD